MYLSPLFSTRFMTSNAYRRNAHASIAWDAKHRTLQITVRSDSFVARSKKGSFEHFFFVEQNSLLCSPLVPSPHPYSQLPFSFTFRPIHSFSLSLLISISYYQSVSLFLSLSLSLRQDDEYCILTHRIQRFILQTYNELLRDKFPHCSNQNTSSIARRNYKHLRDS